MKRGRMSRDDFVEVQRGGASAADSRTLEPARYFPGCWLSLSGPPVVTGLQCTSKFRISGGAANPVRATMEVSHYADADAAAADDDDSRGNPDEHCDETGLTLWPASFLLIEWLASRASQLPQLSLLELGAGCGIVGLAAACLGARTSITDGSKHAVKLAARNISANKLEGVASAKVLLWGQHHQEGLYDLVVACEVAHLEKEVVDLLFCTAEGCLKDDSSQFVIAYLARGPSRLGRKYGAAKLIEAAAKYGLGARLVKIDHLQSELQSSHHRAELISFEKQIDAEASREVGRFLDNLGEKHLQALVQDEQDEIVEQDGSGACLPVF